MATQLQIRRGTAAQVAAFTGAEGEIVYNSTNDSLHTNDGSTAGGFELARVDGSNFALTSAISTTANFSFGDNDKAIFGAGSDLQIYHDGSNSIIYEGGTGDLQLRGNGGSTTIMNGGGTETLANFGNNSSVDLYYDNALKLSTKASGIDVLGTAEAHKVEIGDGSAGGTSEILFSDNVSARGKILYDHSSNPETMVFQTTGTTAISIDNTQDVSIPNGNLDVVGTATVDGLTVDGDTDLGSATRGVSFRTSGTGSYKLSGGNSAASAAAFIIDAKAMDTAELYLATDGVNHLKVDQNGDISFYDTAGSSQALFWDASATSLGIGTSSPSQDLEILNGTTGAGIRLAATATAYWDIERDSTSGHLTFTDDGAGTVLTLGQDGSSVFSGSVSATSGNYTTSGTASLADGTNGLRIVREGGDGAGALGNGITFAQRWWSNSTQNVRTGAIFGKKINGSGSYGGGLAFYSQPASDADMVEALSIDSSQRVNIGSSLMVGSTTAPSYPLEVQSGGVGTVLRAGTSFVSIDSVGSASSPSLILNGDDNTGIWHPASDTLAVSTGGTERMRISNDGSCRWTPDGTNHDMTLTASGDLLVGTTSSSSNTAGIKLSSAGTASFVRSGVQPVYVNRLTNDGDLAVFAKNGTTVGSIGTSLTRLTIGSDDAMLLFDAGSTNAIWPWTSTATSDGDADNTIDIGDTTNRFKDLYLSSGVYLGGTGAANKLDDYEEGTWTPVLVGSTTAGTGTFVSGPTGTYTKTGNQVTVYFNWGISAHTGAGALRVNGLPFTVTGAPVGAVMAGNYTYPAGKTNLVAFGVGTVLRFYGTGDGAGYAENVLDVSHQMNGSLTYTV